MDKTQLGAAIIAFSLVLLLSPFAVGRAVSTNTAWVGAMSAFIIFTSIIFLATGIAVFYIKPEQGR